MIMVATVGLSLDSLVEEGRLGGNLGEMSLKVPSHMHACTDPHCSFSLDAPDDGQSGHGCCVEFTDSNGFLELTGITF